MKPHWRCARRPAESARSVVITEHHGDHRSTPTTVDSTIDDNQLRRRAHIIPASWGNIRPVHLLFLSKMVGVAAVLCWSVHLFAVIDAIPPPPSSSSPLDTFILHEHDSGKFDLVGGLTNTVPFCARGGRCRTRQHDNSIRSSSSSN